MNLVVVKQSYRVLLIYLYLFLLVALSRVVKFSDIALSLYLPMIDLPLAQIVIELGSFSNMLHPSNNAI